MLDLLSDASDIGLLVCRIVIYLETVSHVTQTGPQPTRTLDLWSSCLYFLSAEIQDMVPPLLVSIYDAEYSVN